MAMDIHEDRGTFRSRSCNYLPIKETKNQPKSPSYSIKLPELAIAHLQSPDS